MFKRVHGKRWAGGGAEFWAGLWALPGVLVMGLWIYAAAFGPVTVERHHTTTQGASHRATVALWSSYIQVKIMTVPAVNHPPGSPYARPHAVVGVVWSLDHHGGEMIGDLYSYTYMPDNLSTPIRLANLGLYAGHSMQNSWPPSRTQHVGVPLPLLVLIFVGPWVLLHWKPWVRRDANPNGCPACGYDVRGLERGCPECGWVRQKSGGGSALNDSGG